MGNIASTVIGGRVKPPVEENFEINKYLGKWYEIARLPFWAEKNGFGNCAEYNMKENGHIEVINSMHEGSFDGRLVTKRADGKILKADDPAHLGVSFDYWKLFYAPYDVLKTDYDTFSVVFSSSNFIFKKSQYVWILSRTPTLDDKILDELFSFVQETVGFERGRFVVTPQQGS